MEVDIAGLRGGWLKGQLKGWHHESMMHNNAQMVTSAPATALYFMLQQPLSYVTASLLPLKRARKLQLQLTSASIIISQIMAATPLLSQCKGCLEHATF